MTQTILIVDDSANLRKMVTLYLMREGFHVVLAMNGQEALEVARREQPTLILLDLMMPVMSGTEFIQAYRRIGNAPIMILSAKLEEQDRRFALEMGANDYMTKPFSPRELLTRIHTLIHD